MIFGESANTNKKEGTTVNKIADPKYSMPRWCPSGLTRSQKRKLQRLRAKENQEKEAEKYSMTHIRSIYHHKRDGDQRPLRKIKRPQRQKKTTTVQLFAGMTDSPAIKTGPTVQVADRPTTEADSSAIHHDTCNDVPTPMEEDDLQGEDLVDYEATLEHLEN
jgi:hypothetical protein